MTEKENRWQVFRAVAPYFGRVVSARFIQKTSEHIRNIPRIHNLIEGIYKPKGAHYALAIASMLKNPYADRIAFNADRSWFFHYSPKTGSLDSAVNISLFNCLRDGEPVLVLKQLSDTKHPEGTRYQMLGLGMVEDFDASERLFKIRQLTMEKFQARVDPSSVLPDELIETALQLEALEAWSPFVAEDRAIYQVAKVKRDTAFRKIVLENYKNSCAVQKSKFAYSGVIEAQAAHIIGKEVNGTDDPRNGLALSRTAHWAFDKGIFTISDQYEVLVHPKASQADSEGFQLLELDRQRILLPSEESNYPHLEALEWHRREVFGLFCRE